MCVCVHACVGGVGEVVSHQVMNKGEVGSSHSCHLVVLLVALFECLDSLEKVFFNTSTSLNFEFFKLKVIITHTHVCTLGMSL